MAGKVYAPADTNKDGTVTETEAEAYYKKQNPTKVNAYDALVGMFDDLGIKELGTWLRDTIYKTPTLVDNKSQLMTELYNSKPYTERFSGLDTIRKYNASAAGKDNPMAVMSEAEYLNAETTYKQILAPVSNMYGTDLNKKVGDIIAKNISPLELQERVVIAQSWVNAVDPNIKAQLQSYYQIDDTLLMQYALEPDRGLVEIQKAAGAAQLGAQALQSSIDINKKQSEDIIQSLVSTGASKDLLSAGQQAAATLQEITSGTATAYNPNAGSLVGTQQLAKIEGTNLEAADILGASLGINTGAAEEIRGLKSRERARFEQGQGGTNVLQTNVSGTV
jgi:hypothetical protein